MNQAPDEQDIASASPEFARRNEQHGKLVKFGCGAMLGVLLALFYILYRIPDGLPRWIGIGVSIAIILGIGYRMTFTDTTEY